MELGRPIPLKNLQVEIFTLKYKDLIYITHVQMELHKNNYNYHKLEGYEMDHLQASNNYIYIIKKIMKARQNCFWCFIFISFLSNIPAYSAIMRRLF